MCGIIGYIGKRNAYPILIKGLKRLEYRGYDSCGVATIENKNINIIKTKGKIKNLEKLVNSKKRFSSIGIAHTRWATHGIPNKKNAHPHTDCFGNIAIVHNGIVENYKTLKKYLIKKGHKFKTKTDSEIIAHLIEEAYKKDKNFLNSIKKALSEITGSFGLAIINKEKNKIYAARRGSPIVIGIGENEYFIASDICAIIEHTKNTIFLDDDEVMEISPDNYKINNIKDNKEIRKEVKKVKTNLQEIEKGNYKYFMEKEIFEQPTTIRNALSGRLDIKNLDAKLGGIPFYKNKAIYENLQKIIIIACGSSYHSGLIIKYLIEKYLRIPVIVEIASEFRYKNPIIDKYTLTIPISQSGETADTIGALRVAKSKNSNLLGIVNTVASTIGRECGKGIHIRAGAEIGVASTKAFTNQLIALYLLTIHIGKTSKKINKENVEVFINNLTRLPSLVEETLKNNENIKKICKKYINYNNVIFLARGINYPIALEGALKLKEIAYINAQAYPAGELKHGPLAVIDKNSLCIIIATKNEEYGKIKSTINEIKSRNGKIVCITNKGNKELSKEADHIIYIPKIDYDFEVFLNVIIFQLIAYNWGNLKGCNIDKPRNLAKSVTVE